ncbi:MAG: hypothetical protein HFJ45_01100 [Clostridia bacterium]|nr:hypothetical protein [Clostridia bacterium]
MKNIRRVIAIFLLLILYAYIVNVSSFPNKLLLYNDSTLELKLCPFLKLEGEVQVGAGASHSSNYVLNLSLGNTKLKKVDLSIADKISVVPVRKIDWIKTIYRWSNDSRIFRDRRYFWK